MAPHVMSINSVLFRWCDASLNGVGNALHAKPPAMVEQEGFALLGGDAHPAGPVPLATRAHMEQLCAYDVKSVNWRRVFEALRVLPDHDHTVDWTDGSHFPWWVWLAHTGVVRDVVNDGVISVELEVSRGNKCVLVHSMRGDFRLWGALRRGK